MLPAPLGSPTVSVVIRCSRTRDGVQLALSGAVAGAFTFASAVAAEKAGADWFDANLCGGRLVEIRSGPRLVGVAERSRMACALLGRALRLLG